MHGCRTLFVSLFLISIVAAADWSYVAGPASWSASPMADNKAAMERAYSSCREHQGNTQQSAASGAACMTHFTSLVFESFGAAFGGGYIDDAIQVSIAPATSPSRRISSDKTIEYDAALLNHFNTRFALQGIRAMSVVESHVHPHDGLAIRLNVHGDDSTMHLHTNGSHATVLFDRQTDLQKRGSLDADGQYFRFSGLNGIKAQVHSINQPLHWDESLGEFARHWTQSDLEPKLILRQADAWEIEVCNEQRTATFFYGALSITREDRVDTKYLPIDPLGCQ